MPIPSHLVRKLQDALGPEGAEALVSWMEDVDSGRGEVAELRHEMQVGFARLEAKVDQRCAALETLLERRVADLMKWSFLFWVGAVAAIAALARVLR
jgi:hypothetical protein